MNTGDKTAVPNVPAVLFTHEGLYGRLGACMEIYFTKHADEKFATLARHGVKILRKKVINAVTTPDGIDRSRLPLLIAQSDIDETHVLRVVYKKEQKFIKIITFYPGRKSQYEKK